MPKKYQTSEFTADQLNQLTKIERATATMIEALTIRPEYLKDSGLKDADHIPVTLYEIADVVAEYISKKYEGNIFMPTHTELPSGDEWVSDCFNDEEVREFDEEPEKKKDDILVIRSTVVLSDLSMDVLRRDIIRQKEEGVVMLPCFCEVVMVPKDIEVKVGGI